MRIIGVSHWHLAIFFFLMCHFSENEYEMSFQGRCILYTEIHSLEINIITPSFIWLMSVMVCFFYLFFKFICLYVKWVSWRHDIVGSCFSIPCGKFCPLSTYVLCCFDNLMQVCHLPVCFYLSHLFFVPILIFIHLHLCWVFLFWHLISLVCLSVIIPWGFFII
jgi:hypothetical protein